VSLELLCLDLYARLSYYDSSTRIAPAARISLLKLAAREDASRRTADRSEHPLLLSEMALTILRHGWAPTARNKFSVYYDRSQHGY
jgi:hypothetical protein